MERYSRWETGSRLIANMDGDNKEIKEEVFCFLFWIVGGDHVDHGVRSVARARVVTATGTRGWTRESIRGE